MPMPVRFAAGYAAQSRVKRGRVGGFAVTNLQYLVDKPDAASI